LSDKLQIMMVPADGKFFFANDVLRSMNMTNQAARVNREKRNHAREALIKYRKGRHKVPRLRRIAEKRQFCFARDDRSEEKTQGPSTAQNCLKRQFCFARDDR